MHPEFFESIYPPPFSVSTSKKRDYIRNPIFYRCVLRDNSISLVSKCLRV